MTEAEFYERMAAMLQSWAGAAAPAAVSPHANLFEHGLLTSLTAVRALVVIEGWAEREIDVERYGIWGMWTLQEMYRIFTAARQEA